MKPPLIVLATLVAILHTVGQIGRPAQTQAVDTVLGTDRQLDRAWNDKDVGALDQLWADDYLFIGWTGEIMDKHERLAAIRSGKFQVQSVHSDEVKVRVFDDAIVNEFERIEAKSQFAARELLFFEVADGS